MSESRDEIDDIILRTRAVEDEIEATRAVEVDDGEVAEDEVSVEERASLERRSG